MIRQRFDHVRFRRFEDLRQFLLELRSMSSFGSFVRSEGRDQRSAGIVILE